MEDTHVDSQRKSRCKKQQMQILCEDCFIHWTEGGQLTSGRTTERTLDEVRHTPSGSHIIVVQQIQSLLELAGKMACNNDLDKENQWYQKEVPKDTVIRKLFYLSFRLISFKLKSLSLSPFSTGVRSTPKCQLPADHSGCFFWNSSFN